MRNFGSMETGFADASAQAICLGAPYDRVADAMPAHDAIPAGKGASQIPVIASHIRRNGVLVFQYACRRSSSACSGGLSSTLRR